MFKKLDFLKGKSEVLYIVKVGNQKLFFPPPLSLNLWNILNLSNVDVAYIS